MTVTLINNQKRRRESARPQNTNNKCFKVHTVCVCSNVSAQNEPNPSEGCKEALAVKTSAAVDGISATIKLGPGCTRVCPLVVETGTKMDVAALASLFFFNESRFEASR